MNMMNKCAKFHKDRPSDKKVKLNLPSAFELRRRPFLCTTLYRNPMQVGNFGGTFDQLFLRMFLWNFHRRCLSTSSILWCKKVKNDQKLKSRGSLSSPFLFFLGFYFFFFFFPFFFLFVREYGACNLLSTCWMPSKVFFSLVSQRPTF